jgi:hypothetical protein
LKDAADTGRQAHPLFLKLLRCSGKQKGSDFTDTLSFAAAPD